MMDAHPRGAVTGIALSNQFEIDGQVVWRAIQMPGESVGRIAFALGIMFDEYGFAQGHTRKRVHSEGRVLFVPGWNSCDPEQVVTDCASVDADEHRVLIEDTGHLALFEGGEVREFQLGRMLRLLWWVRCPREQ
ncbi:MAG: hypothetical protein CMJ35_01450 [Phycisphaerae bacterium]|nr:hypothetical protein [Phycisphaerae bacterium]